MEDDKKSKILEIDLDQFEADAIKNIQDAVERGENVDDSSAEFNAVLDTYERYLNVRQQGLRQKTVHVKDIVADEDAVKTTLKTYHAINEKIQQQIADGTELSRNDINLLIEMMRVLNGEK